MNAIKELQKLESEMKRSRYSVPDNALPKTRHSDSTANGLTKAILQWLTLNGHYCSRIQSQGQYRPKLGKWTRSTVKRGIGDITSIIRGHSIMIEVKAGKDKQSTWQKQTQAEVERSGGVYLIVRNFDDFMRWYREFTCIELDEDRPSEGGTSPNRTRKDAISHC